MKCDLCDKEATVHEWTKKAGQKHLCEECARKQGVAIQPQQQISQLITQLIGTSKPGGPHAPLTPTVQVNACATCGTTYAQFRHSGLLGCPACYSIFEAQLGPLLQRAHEGGTHHAGKTPPTALQGAVSVAPVPPDKCTPAAEVSQPARAARVQALREQLADAITAEQYELAAALRDELNALDAPSSPSNRTPPAGSTGAGGPPSS